MYKGLSERSLPHDKGLEVGKVGGKGLGWLLRVREVGGGLSRPKS